MKNTLYILLGLSVFLTLSSCRRSAESVESHTVNPAHLDRLFESRLLDSGDTIGIVYVRGLFPDYAPAPDPREGIANVSDAARAAVFYLRHYRQTGRPESYRQARQLLKFLLYMQDDNGYFFNYLLTDNRINKNTLESKAMPGMWSWQAFWALGEAMRWLHEDDPLQEPVDAGRQELVQRVLADRVRNRKTQTIGGLSVPSWLPRESSAREAALLLTGLAAYHRDHPWNPVQNYMEDLADGIVRMQVSNQGRFPEAAFLSWKNLWYANNNQQSYALLCLSETIQDPSYARYANREVENYYPRVRDKEHLSEWIFEKEAVDTFDVVREQQFPQQPADLRPMIWACVKSWQDFGNYMFLEEAKLLSQWFLGDNPAGAIMYDRVNGRALNRITDFTSVDKNASAAATLEALLAVQALAYPDFPL